MDTEPFAAPQARRQHEPHEANPGWPHWGRDALDHGHSIYAIASHLRTLGQTAWLARLMRWLSHYDGIERYVEPEHDPCVCVRDLLACHVAHWHAPEAPEADAALNLRRRLAAEIVQLGFLRYRAYWGRGLLHDPDARIWQPLEQPWLSFVDLGLAGQLLVVQEFDAAKPPVQAHLAFLMQGGKPK